MTVARLSGRIAEAFHGPRDSFLARWNGLCWSGEVRDRLDALSGDSDLLCPGPGGGDFRGSAGSAVDGLALGVV